MKRTLCAVLMVMLAGSLLLTGCPQPTPTPTTTSPTPTPTTTSPTTTTPTDTGSGVLHLYAIDPITLDPAVSGESTSHEYVLQIYSGRTCASTTASR
jgi:ABC-type transport system substrate-binding protein